MAFPYSKRYTGGFLDLPSETTAIDSAFLNAVEAALIALCETTPADNTVPVASGGTFTAAQIANAQVAAAAAIAYSKLNLAGSVVNADIATGAAIAYAKLALSGSIVNADVATAAAIAYSKLNLSGAVVNADIATGAAIAISKLAGYPNDATKVLKGDGSWAVSASGSTLVSHTEFTANVTISGVTQVVIEAGAHTYDGSTAYDFIISAPAVNTGASAGAYITHWLYEDGNQLCKISEGSTPAAAVTERAVFQLRKFTPAAGSHTYAWKAESGGAAGLVIAGDGATTHYAPGYLRIVKSPT